MARLTPLSLVLVLFSPLVVHDASPAAARCRMQGVAPRLLIAEGHEYARDAELVVALVTSGDQVRGFPEDMRLEREEEEPITLRRREIAPDLATYQLSREPSPGEWNIVNGGTTLPRTITFGRHRRARSVPAPQLVDVQVRRTQRGRSNERTLHAQVAEPPAADILTGVFRATRAEISRALMEVGRTDVTLFGWRHRCRRWPEELSAPPEHGQAQLQWISVDGRRGGWSNRIQF